MKIPAETEVSAGQELPESGRPDSNRRRPAWEASDPVRTSAHQRKEGVSIPCPGIQR
jgi:hypothetical protein